VSHTYLPPADTSLMSNGAFLNCVHHNSAFLVISCYRQSLFPVLILSPMQMRIHEEFAVCLGSHTIGNNPVFWRFLFRSTKKTLELRLDQGTIQKQFSTVTSVLTFSVPTSLFIIDNIWRLGACGSVVGWGTILQARSQVRFPVKSLDFSTDLILPAALWP
jgi:hypothetical protein